MSKPVSKNKNPLKDLEQFLKQEAATIVSPSSLKEKVNEISDASQDDSKTSDEFVTTFLQTLLRRDPKQFYDLLLKVAAADISKTSPMLVNTILYLKSGDAWKEEIQKFWQSRN